jgi:lipopolysaccharide export system permease protein
MGIKKLHILVFRSFIGPFIATFFVSLFLFLLQFLWKYIGDLIGKGLEWYVILEFIGYSAIHLIPMALPLAMLLSSIMAFGSLGEHYELVAIKSAGISLLRFLVPMYAITLLIAGFAFYASNILIPKANLSWGALLYDVSNKRPAFNIREGVFFKDIDGYAIKIGKKLKDNKTIEDILIYVNTSGRGNNNIVVAKSGTMQLTPDEKFLVLSLRDGIKYQEMVDNPGYYKAFQHNVMRFKTQDIAIDLSDLKFKRTKKDLFKEDYRMMNVNELSDRIDSLRRIIAERQRLTYQFITPYFHFNIDSSQHYKFKKEDLKKKFHQTLGSFRELNYIINESYSKTENSKNSKKIKIEDNRDSLRINESVNQGMTVNVSGKTDYKPEILESSKQFARNIKNIVETSYKDVLNQRENQLKYEVEWHKKYTLAISCILLFFIGAPMGAIIRRGGFGWPMVVSVVLFILYFSINLIGEKLARGEVLPAAISVWMSTIILFPFALILTIKANRDAKFFEGGVKWTWLTGIFKKKQSNQSKIITITEGNQSQSEQS